MPQVTTLPPVIAGEAGGLNLPALESAFRAFLQYPTISSKDSGLVKIQLFDAQEYFLREIFRGLAADVHWFVVGKGRQLGITTICLLLDCFWCGALPGVQGAIVFDSIQNKEKFRILLKGILDRLERDHPAFALPIDKHDRDFIQFKNGNVLDYMTAGTKIGQGTLGRSRALNFVHATEVCSYGDEKAFQAFRDAMSDLFPARLYIMESTARGYNLFNKLWDEAERDPIAKRTIFLGWWRKATNSYRHSSALFGRYGYVELSRWEEEMNEEVWNLYRHRITLEQWAWYRHRIDPSSAADFESDDEDRIVTVQQEHPTTPDQMFSETGSYFIPSIQLNDAIREARRHPFKGFHFFIGEDITAVRIEPVVLARQAQLRLWEEPVPSARYVLAADPAYASSDDSDFFSITVLRCYGDRLEQVAEFSERNMQDYQFAWVMAYLANMYGNCRIILEINGPGEAVLVEFRHLRTMLETGKFNVSKPPELWNEEDFAHNRRYKRFLQGVGDYMYHRPDSFGGGYNAQWKTSAQNRPAILIQMRDQFMSETLRVYSVECLMQMRRLRHEGMAIQPEGTGKDDRVFTMAMAVRCWIEFERMALISEGRLYEIERQREQPEEIGTVGKYMQVMLKDSMAARREERRAAERLAARPGWRAGVWRGRR